MRFDKNDKDDFWDIEKLIPKNKSSQKNTKSSLSLKWTEDGLKYAESSNGKIETAPHCSEGTGNGNSQGKLTVSFDSTAKREEHTYVPNNRFFGKVTVESFPDRYDFYGNFRKNALVYFDFKAPKCSFASFYSYMPQYSQMSNEAKSFYFYWRDEVRRGNYIKTDYSYLYLYVYEIINLPDKIKPQNAVNILCDLWREYRATLPRIDERFIVWVRDFCLVNMLDLPIDKINGFIFDILESRELCEFYLSGFDSLGRVPSEVLTAYLSDYDWRRGKYAGGESADIYASLMQDAMDGVISHVWQSGKIGVGLGEPKTLRFTAFPNTLCTHDVKKNITVEYYPLSTSPALRAGVTAAVKYTENKLRALLGIKSRLAVKELDTEHKAIIDAYFTKIINKRAIDKERENRPEYEKMYDSAEKTLSVEDASRIEEISWLTTARLVADAESDSGAEESVSLVNESTEDTSPVCELDEGCLLAQADIELIRSSLLGECFSDGAAAERINEMFIEIIGDVIFDSDGEQYSLIEDYREDVEKWIRDIMN